MADELSTPRTRRGESGNTMGCVGCLGTTLLLMLLSAAVVWALNPGMSFEDAARDGILIGGGLSVASMAMLCAIPGTIILVVVGLIAFGFLRKRRAAGRSTVIDAEFD